MPTPERHHLSLAQLAEFDDLLTDSLVDRVYYWSAIRKMKHTYHPNRGVKTDAVTRIIVDGLVKNKSVAASLQQFLELDGIRGYLSKISKNENLKADFVKHARRYLSIYLPDCPFEVSATNRYNLTRAEACILARKPLPKGDTIKYLTGAMVKMSEDEEEAYTHGKTDFSIIYSSRVGGMSLLLGPARFVNHDCEPNARFITTNKDHIHLLALQDIGVGEEITVSYANDYFGENNGECLCRSCEAASRNGWAPDNVTRDGEGDVGMEDAPHEPAPRRTRSKRRPEASPELPPPPEKRARRKSNKEDVLTPPYSDRATPEDPKLPVKSAVKVEDRPQPDGAAVTAVAAATAAATAPAAAVTAAVATAAAPPPPPLVPTPESSGGTPTLNPELATPVDIAESLLALSQSPGYHRPLTFSPQGAAAAAQRPSAFGDRASDFGRALSYEAVAPQPERPPSLLNIDSRRDSPQSVDSPAAPVAGNSTPRLPTEDGQTVAANGTAPPSLLVRDDKGAEDDSELSELSETEVLRLGNSITKSNPKRKSEGKKNSGSGTGSALPPSRRKSAVHYPPPTALEPARKRVPGDYINFYDSDCIKCTCSDCREDFLHNDRWYVPRSCRRCERHSKIYGLVWPKTMKKKGDSEIEDHRLVQRYITASEHRKEQKRLAEAKVAQQHQHQQPTAKKAKR